jgi:hypothetical protein
MVNSAVHTGAEAISHIAHRASVDVVLETVSLSGGR